MTIIPPEPIMDPEVVRASKSTARSRNFPGRHPPEGPPVWTALKRLFFRTPPPISSIIVRRVVPMGISTRPEFLTFPTREKILVPGLFSVPIERNRPGPSRTMRGTLAQVSTLFRTVGQFQSPLSVERMYFTRGSPARPSMEAMRAEDSPQTKAPPPRQTSRSKSKPVPRMSRPSRPRSFACRIASCRALTARGYSART